MTTNSIKHFVNLIYLASPPDPKKPLKFFAYVLALLCFWNCNGGLSAWMLNCWSLYPHQSEPVIIFLWNNRRNLFCSYFVSTASAHLSEPVIIFLVGRTCVETWLFVTICQLINIIFDPKQIEMLLPSLYILNHAACIHMTTILYLKSARIFEEICAAALL